MGGNSHLKGNKGKISLSHKTTAITEWACACVVSHSCGVLHYTAHGLCQFKAVNLILHVRHAVASNQITVLLGFFHNRLLDCSRIERISRGLMFGPRSLCCGKQGWAVRQRTVLSLRAGSSVETSPASWPVLGFPPEGALGGPALHLCSVPRLDIPQSA